ncbi:hypothetical protein RND81_06G148100 [Saponaria officinalis]|uniref:Uncharacterized protein n=1 Tax=Saponaria officinalis TaxID=3572 RepID=A0AAW1KBW2_SAPOF
MDFLPSYAQVDQPRHQYGRGEDDYPPPINPSPYSSPPLGLTYEDGPYRPPPSYRDTYDQQQAPPPRGYNTKHPPYMNNYQNYPPPPTPPPSSYVVNEDNPHFKPHMPDVIEGYFHDSTNNKTNNYVSQGVGLVGHNMGFVENKPSYKIYCKAGGGKFAVTIRDGKVVLTRPNSSDPAQNWYRDERYSTKAKDEERHPSFILVNKATAQAVKHSVAGYPVQLIPYNPDALDESIMWTESKDLGSGFRTIRTVNNVGLVMDAWNADKDHGGIRDGTVVALFKCWKGDNQNQQWKFVPY